MSNRCYSATKIIISVALAFSACRENVVETCLFIKQPPSKTNIVFENTLSDTDDFNIIEYLYYYNGAGVAVGDINNDGLPDIYFSSNQKSNKLYLNKGDFVFEDVTETAGVSAAGNWKTGVTMADVNGDGFLDIFVCGVGQYKKFNGRNQLFINNGDLTFTDMTDACGLAFQGFSTQASFFDYDNDGDLDMYLVNHAVHTRRSYGNATLLFQQDSLAGDRLYQNQLVPSGKVHFTDVSVAAGILNSQIGYGLGVGVSDLDQDGFLDIYVSNDFNENDYLYINQHDGTFKQELERSIPHSSRFSMGNDIADINNDGLPDIVTLDMLPKNEAVIKTTAGEDPYEIYEFKLRHGYHYQFSRNALQLNRGVDAKHSLMFSDIAPMAGVEATDWSWAPLLADFDNDGYKDLFVANGILGRPNDLDYINFINSDSAQRYFSDQKLIEQMPSGKVANIFYKNNGNLSFQDVSNAWIGNEASLSNGAAYGDLDNDGDLDLVVNNINQQPFIYRNELKSPASNFLNIKLVGNGANRFGVGAKVWIYARDKKIFQEQIPSRGWLSSVDYTIHVGLGAATADSIVVVWPGNKAQTLKAIGNNDPLVIKQTDSLTEAYHEAPEKKALLTLEQITFPYKHTEDVFTAFNIERLMPHMLSTQGPKIAVGDIDGDHLDDFFVGGAAGQPGAVFKQEKHGRFIPMRQPSLERDSLAEDIDACFVDVDQNGTLDLIVVGGGQEFKGGNKNLVPRLYLNNGKGQFEKQVNAMPAITVNASCISPADIDQDGDIDFFIGGRVVPGQYGLNPQSFLLINNGHGIFTNETQQRLGPNAEAGMVSDAVWADVNKDNLIDLVMVGEWMPITVLIQNNSGKFNNQTNEYGLGKTSGWWNTIVAHDFDKDGNVDFVAGNLGLNSRLKANEKEPVKMYVGDIDNNNSLDHILTYYNQGKSHPFLSRDQMVKQIPSMRKRFLKYDNFKDVNLDEIIEPTLQRQFLQKEVQTFESVFIKNNGNKKLSLFRLPAEAQMFPIFSFCIDDLNDDGYDDVVLVGNLDATQPEFGRYDAGYGLILLNDRGSLFKSLEWDEGFVVNGQGRDIKIVKQNGKKLFLVSRNDDSIKVFSKVVKE